jgi:voltage-gated potassium channel
MARQTKLERWIDRQLRHTQSPRQAAVVIAVVSTSITLIAGLLMTVIDHRNFPSLGSGLWWAVQTVTTVGYGDRVPTSVGGQLLAALVMLLGIGFITVITAAITSSFVSRARLERSHGDGVSLAEQFTKIDERLARIEEAVRRP